MALMVEYEYMQLYLPRDTSRNAVRQVLTDHAEYGHWELARLRRYPDGSGRAWLRRKIIRHAQPTPSLRMFLG